MAPPQSFAEPPVPPALRLSFVAFTFLFVCAALMSFGQVGNGNLLISEFSTVSQHWGHAS
jgi:hypothetical protein